MKLFKKIRSLFKKTSSKERADRLDGPPETVYGFDPHAEAYLGSEVHRLPSPAEGCNTFANITDFAALPVAPNFIQDWNSNHADTEQPSRLNGPFVPEFEPNGAYGSQAHPYKAPTSRQPAHLLGKQDRGPRYNHAATDPFSLKDMREALPEIGRSAALPAFRPEASAGRPSYGGSSNWASESRDGRGTYGNRSMEQSRLRIKAFGKYECEHVYGVSTVNPGVQRNSPEGSRLEGAMPAYYETMHLHQEHAGSGYGTRELAPEIHGGWQTTDNFRHDQRETLRDAVAAHEGTSASNGYQLTELGYAHILRAEEKGLSRPHLVPDYIRRSGGNLPPLPPSYYVDNQEAIATNSYNNMVTHDPPIIHRLNGKQESVRLGPRGQVEALLGREMAMSGEWPDNRAVTEISRDVLPPPAYQEKLDIWKAMDSGQPNPAPTYRDRGRSGIGGR